MNAGTIFLTVASVNNLIPVRLMIDSLRSFGGDLADSPVWVFATDLATVPGLEEGHTRLYSLSVPDPVAGYLFGKIVAACARAEELAPSGTRSLVFIDPTCLVVQPPLLFGLGSAFDAAFRPVHLRNVGLSPSEPLDPFWKGIYSAVGVDEIHTTVTSFVDRQLLRAYYNSHSFAVDPALGLMHRWYDLFLGLVGDDLFQSTACADEDHQVFLFQALLGTLVATMVEPGRLCLLPETYNYPYHLQDQIPGDRRLSILNESACFTYEDRPLHPSAITGIEVREPLKSWLATHIFVN